ncbi:translation initiation factor IF-2-like [Rousettus aegyptiacus]|uniref:translation initiation factor IF-2-like n=1 Tax=Rousettus aegyptiacus TaxID=9407 RepID=UPI00168D329F|nr:translation initiation factor IF-2-like [Rousettus aegyptiacus]
MTKRRDSPSPPQPSTPRRSPTPRATPGGGDEAVKPAARPLAQDAGRRARRRRWRADYLHASSSGRASLAACPPAPRGAPGVSLQGAPRAPRRGGANATGLGARCSVPACAHSWPPWDARPRGHLHLPRFTGGKTERGSGQLAPWAGRRGAGSERRKGACSFANDAGAPQSPGRPSVDGRAPRGAVVAAPRRVTTT